MAAPLPANPPEKHPVNSLIRKLLLLFLLAIDVALGLIYLLTYGNPVGYLGQLLFAAGVLGLVAGLAARLVLRRRRPLLRVLAALSMLTLGLSLIGGFTGWKFGLGPLTFRPGHLDLKGLVQLVFGSLSALLMLFAWKKTPAETAPTAEAAPAQAPARRSPASATRQGQRARKAPGAAPSTSSKSRPAVKKTAQTAASPKDAGRPKARQAAALKARKPSPRPSTPDRKRRSSQPGIQFMASEEHRCPYCLDIVQPDDPRGIVECKICHTLHHADCWAITGTCQVPHLNS